eukprot:m.367014 g.367014  ORF g.367014 m.367014 type:complete len:111 (-) comp38662_c0_seq1:29-361(-)
MQQIRCCVPKIFTANTLFACLFWNAVMSLLCFDHYFLIVFTPCYTATLSVSFPCCFDINDVLFASFLLVIDSSCSTLSFLFFFIFLFYVFLLVLFLYSCSTFSLFLIAST